MKTTKNLIGTISLVLMMVISLSVNSQTLIENTDYKVIGTTASGNTYSASDFVIVYFTEPVDLTKFDKNGNLNDAYTLTSITYLKTTNNKVTTSSELISGYELTKSYNKVVSMTLKIKYAPLKFTLTGTKASIALPSPNVIYTAVDTLKAYNNGIAVGKESCSSTKSEVLKSAEVSVYPNPTLDGNTNVEINGTTTNVNISNDPGLYLINVIEISTGRSLKTVKVLNQ
jgi:hypothetical protein